MDEHIPKPITEKLRLRGVDVLTVQAPNNVISFRKRVFAVVTDNC